MKTQSGKIRIISGENKGRVLHFPAVNGLRPTPDRIRETLFNWLAPCIQGSSCLDLFAGSGALGFEAISRGAQTVTFVDANRKACRMLETNIRLLNLNQASVMAQSAQTYLNHCHKQFEIIFLDPPFSSNLLQSSVDLIHANKLIKNNGWIYIEHSAHQQPLSLPQSWTAFRQTRAGDVSARLLHHQPAESIK